jgi:prepilin-type N-terminal cleavage/methylation domain-containing protein
MRIPTRTSNPQGFTLIELLVVITIIGILATMGLSGGSRLIERGKLLKCQANLRQLGVALTNYLNDQDDIMPATANIWAKKLKPNVDEGKSYIDTWKLFKSPFDPRKDSEIAPQPVSYGLNKNLESVNVSRLKDSTNTIVLAPAPEEDDILTFKGTADAPVDLTPGKGENRGTHTNRARISVLFLDGSVRDMKFSDFNKDAPTDDSDPWASKNTAKTGTSGTSK